MHEKETILITGGAGFIGSNLCEFLIHQKFRVICLDNFDDFYPEEIKLNNLNGLFLHPLFELVRGDIRDSELLDRLFTQHHISFVLHLAAKAGVRNSISNPEEYFDVNVKGSICLFETMKTHGVRNIIFSSSSSVYGNRNGQQSETDSCDCPISPYAVSKRAVEIALYNYHLNSGFNVINLRLFSVYGKNQRPDLVLHKFVDLIIRNEPIEIFGSIETTRDYTYIEDVVSAFYSSIQLLKNNRNNIYEIINIGNDNPVNLKQLIDLIKLTLNQNTVKIIANEPIEGEVNSTHADINKAKSILKYRPTISIENGVNLFYKWYSKTKI